MVKLRSPPRRVTILGGGISGLVAAYRLAIRSKSNPMEIRVIEGSDRMGGWLKSKKVEGITIFESGPRSLRPTGVAGLATLGLVDQLNLTEKVVAVPKSAPAAKNRCIYYNNEIHQLPSSLLGLVADQSPVLTGIVTSLLKEPFVRTSLPPEGDETIHDFITRRFGEPLATNLVSAIVHGIYAGNSKELSVRNTFKLLYELERDYGSIVKGLIAKSRQPEDPELLSQLNALKLSNPTLASVYSDSSMYSFVGGMETLSSTLHKKLKTFPNVEVATGHTVDQLSLEGDVIKVHTTNSQRDHSILEADHVISALPSLSLAKILPHSPPELTHNPSVTVGVVGFAYNQKVLPYDAFGYLVPRSVPDSRALGVVFDSCSFPGASPGHETLTVMMGGHQFRDRVGDPATVTEDDLLTHAYHTLQHHLNITAIPTAHHVNLHHQCIPQYLLYHHSRMQTLHSHLTTNYSDKLSVVGASYTGVAINDIVYHVQRHIDRLLTTDHSPVTGLESYLP